MKLFCGIVLNTDSIDITILDERQTEILDKKVPTEASPVIAALAPHRRDLESIVMEATTDPQWLIDALKQEGFSNVHSVS